jgi:hypothetical protein
MKLNELRKRYWCFRIVLYEELGRLEDIETTFDTFKDAWEWYDTSIDPYDDCNLQVYDSHEYKYITSTWEGDMV